jgi:hypothetical protein
MFGPYHGKKLWAWLLKVLGGKEQAPPDGLVLADGGDPGHPGAGPGRRALSAAYGICDTLRYSREGAIFRPAEPDWKAAATEPAPNARVYQMVKDCRAADFN